LKKYLLFYSQHQTSFDELQFLCYGEAVFTFTLPPLILKTYCSETSLSTSKLKFTLLSHSSYENFSTSLTTTVTLFRTMRRDYSRTRESVLQQLSTVRSSPSYRVPDTPSQLLLVPVSCLYFQTGFCLEGIRLPSMLDYHVRDIVYELSMKLINLVSN